MANLAAAAAEVFETLLAFDYTVKLYGADGQSVVEPTEARWMVAASPNLMVALDDADDDTTVRLIYGKSTHAVDIDGLIQTLRTVTTKYNMSFEDKQSGQEIDPKNFRNIKSVAESHRDRRNMQLCEGMYGTTRSSYLVLENARLIVHHHPRINLRENAARSRHIADMVIEDAQGKRHALPTTDLRAARAMTEHVNAGGSVYDARGAAILATYAVRSAEDSTPYLAENHPAIRSFLRWADRFVPERTLSESIDPYSPHEGEVEEADAKAIRDFHVIEFMDSDAFADLTQYRYPGMGEESEIAKDELLSTLAHYLRGWIETFTPEFSGRGYTDNTYDLAQHVLPKAVEGLQRAGWMVVDDTDPHLGLHEDDQALMDEEELTREDVLLPSRNQGRNFSREIGKAMVHDDPSHPDQEHVPGRGYAQRLRPR